MRPLLALVWNLIVAVFTLLGTPFRLLRVSRRPEYVRFHLQGDPPYRKGVSAALRRARKTVGPSLVTSIDAFRRQLDHVVADPTVKGVIVKLEELHVSPAKRQALVQLLERAREAGKDVIAFAVSASNGDYPLLAAASKIAMPPAGRLELTGFAAEAMTLGRGLERLGVRAEFVRRGPYKTAPELFTHAEVSDIQRETIEKLIDERYEELVDVLTRRRALPREDAVARIDRGPYSARRAQSQGLIDLLVSEVELAERLAPEGRKGKGGRPGKARIGSYRAWAGAHLWPKGRWMRFSRAARLSVVPVKGAIVHGEGAGGVGMRTAGSDGIVKALREAASAHTSAVLLYVESPGGSALASELILEEVRRTAEKKPVLAYFDQVAASGGYMAALGAKEIWSAPHAVVGSIGVFAGKFDLSGLLARFGIHRTVITRGENAGILSSARGFTENERAALELDVEETYQDFLGHVARARHRTREEIHARAEGRVYSGTAAREAGLVDQVSGFEDACRRALELADKRLARFDLEVHKPKGRFSWVKLLQQSSRTQLYAVLPFWLAGFEGSAEFD